MISGWKPRSVISLDTVNAVNATAGLWLVATKDSVCVLLLPGTRAELIAANDASTIY